MNKNVFAKTPPMGWNSWDCYGAAVTDGNILYVTFSGMNPLQIQSLSSFCRSLYG